MHGHGQGRVRGQRSLSHPSRESHGRKERGSKAMQEQAGVPRKLPRSGLVQPPIINIFQYRARFWSCAILRSGSTSGKAVKRRVIALLHLLFVLLENSLYPSSDNLSLSSPSYLSITTYYQLLRKSSGKGLRSLRFGLFLQSGHQPINIFMSMFTKAFNHKTFIQ